MSTVTEAMSSERSSEADFAAGLVKGLKATGRALSKIILTLAVVVLAWLGLIVVVGLEPYQVPMPFDAATALVEDHTVILEGLRVTLIETMAGLGVSLAFASILAVLFVRSVTMERALLPMAIAFRAIPVVAMAPLLVLLVGRGLGTGVVTVMIVTFFPILINLVRGMRSLSSRVGELMHVLGASTSQLFWYARIPAAAPYLFIGLRIAAAEGFAAAMLAEWLTGNEGVGHLLVYAAGRRDVDLLWATMAAAASVSILIFHLTGALERAVSHRFPTVGH